MIYIIVNLDRKLVNVNISAVENDSIGVLNANYGDFDMALNFEVIFKIWQQSNVIRSGAHVTG